MGAETDQENSDAEIQARRGKRLLFWVVVVFLAVNAAILYRVIVGP